MIAILPSVCVALPIARSAVDFVVHACVRVYVSDDPMFLMT